MQSWYTSQELEQLGLPALPTTGRRIREKADRESWLRRERTGRGGGFEYPIEALPTEARAELDRRAAEEAGLALGDLVEFEAVTPDKIEGAPAPEANVLCGLVGIGRKRQSKMEAKLLLVRHWRAMHESAGRKPTVTQAWFADLYNSGRIEVAAWVREVLPSITQASLRRWTMTLEQEGEMALAGGYRTGNGVIDGQPEVRRWILGMVANYPSRPSAVTIHRSVRAHFRSDADVLVPDLRSVQRWIKAWYERNPQTALALANPDAWRSRFQAAFGSRSEHVVRLNQVWELDSTPADVLLVDGRYAVIGVIDVYSRRAKLLVSRTSKSVAIGALTRRAILDWGVPEVYKTDNGSDYTSRHLERVIDGLEIEHQLCVPFSPDQKPHIERFFKTFLHGIFELLPGYVGHNVTDRKAIENRKSFAQRMMTAGETVELAMNATELQAFCDQYCDALYHHDPHGSLDGKTPWQMAAEWPHPLNRITNERGLDVLLAEAPSGEGQRTVHKKGLRLDNAVFIAPELEEYIGQAVHVRFDPADYGRVFVFDARTMAFVCVAVCPDRLGYEPAQVKAIVAETAARQKKRIAAELKELDKAAKEVRAAKPLAEIMREAEEEAGKLAAFPQQAIEYETDAMREAAKVVAALDAPPVPAQDPDVAARGAEIIERQNAEQAQQEEDPMDTFRRLYWAQARGETISPEDAARMARIAALPAGKGLKMALDYERAQKAATQEGRDK